MFDLSLLNSHDSLKELVAGVTLWLLKAAVSLDASPQLLLHVTKICIIQRLAPGMSHPEQVTGILLCRCSTMSVSQMQTMK